MVADVDEEALQEAWEERAAIMEYDGGYSRSLAERYASERMEELMLVQLELGFDDED